MPKKPNIVDRKQVINIAGVYRQCDECQAHLHFKGASLVLSGGVVIKPLPGSKNEFIITPHRPDCKVLG